ncbi:MAG: HupE/UreJ family protein [Pseudomonadales bacterium]
MSWTSRRNWEDLRPITPQARHPLHWMIRDSRSLHAMPRGPLSKRVDLRPSRLRMPTEGLDTFLSGRAWPRTILGLQGSLGRPADEGYLRVSFEPTFIFEEPIAVTLRDATSGRTVTRWLIALQRSPVLALGTTASPAPVDDYQEAPATIAARFLVEGFRHIVPAGIDHLLFVVGLYFGVRSRARLLALVSLYTVAHSITLALAAFSLVEVDSEIVEPAIALSIAWVGVENLRAEARFHWRMLIVFTLGLIHVLGFAGSLRESGLPADSALWALVSFNAGVELGQLTCLATLAAALLWWQRQAWYEARIARPASVIIAVIGVLWTVERIAT